MPPGTGSPCSPRCIMVGSPQLTSSSCRRSSKVATVPEVGAASGTGPGTLPLPWRRLRLGQQPTPGRKERTEQVASVLLAAGGWSW